jgi:tetratricopeptide (TPR) repeat protein
VAKALQKDKSARYQTAAELQADLLRLKHDLDTGRKTIPKRLLPWGIAAAAVLLCIALITYRLTTSAPNRVARSQSTIHSSRRSLAVLGFQNLTGRRNIEWLSTALSEMLSTELAAGQNLRIVPGENVARAKAGLSLVTFDTYNEHTLTRLKKNLRTDLVVLGSYVDLGTQAGNQLRVDVRLQDTARGETLLAISETGTESNLFQLVSLIGSQLREKLSVGEVPASEMEGVRASLPSNADVMRLYAEGLKALRVFDFLPARDLLRKVVSAQPDYAPGHSALSLAYSALGYDEDARREGKRAYELSAGLSREDRLAIEAHYREATREWDQAIQIYRSLWRSFPDNIEYGLRLAAAQTFAGNGQDALKTVIELRKLPNPSRDDPRIDLAQAAAFNSLGDFEQTLRATESAIAKSGGSHLVLAGAYHSKGWALYRTGRSPEALIALRQAQKLYSAASQKQGTARMLNVIGDIIYTSGDLAKARELYEEALAIYRETGDQAGIAIALNDIANALYTKGDFAKARPLYEESLEINRAVGSKRGVAGALGNLANVLDSEGDLEAAGKAQEEALVAFRQIGDQRGASATLTNIGTLLLEKGDLLGARKAQEQAVADAGKINFKSGVAYALQGLGEALVPQDDLEGARRNFEKAIAIRHDSGEHGALAETWIDLADLSIHEGKFNAAEQMARSAIQELQSDKEFAEEALATAVLARAELAQGKLSEAKLASSRATSVIPQSAAYPYRFLVDIASARVRTATGEGREAEKTVQGVIEIARRYGYLGYEFEGRLALGEIESKSGKRAAGVAVLKDLQRDAGLKGFSLIAREAHDAVSRGR